VFPLDSYKYQNNTTIPHHEEQTIDLTVCFSGVDKVFGWDLDRYWSGYGSHVDAVFAYPASPSSGMTTAPRRYLAAAALAFF
jgi:hypothetical protein